VPVETTNPRTGGSGSSRIAFRVALGLMWTTVAFEAWVSLAFSGLLQRLGVERLWASQWWGNPLWWAWRWNSIAVLLFTIVALWVAWSTYSGGGRSVFSFGIVFLLDPLRRLTSVFGFSIHSGNAVIGADQYNEFIVMDRMINLVPMVVVATFLTVSAEGPRRDVGAMEPAVEPNRRLARSGWIAVVVLLLMNHFWQSIDSVLLVVAAFAFAGAAAAAVWLINGLVRSVSPSGQQLGRVCLGILVCGTVLEALSTWLASDIDSGSSSLQLVNGMAIYAVPFATLVALVMVDVAPRGYHRTRFGDARQVR
jgi:hypothetical protein